MGHDNEGDLGENEETGVKNSLYLFDTATSWLIITSFSGMEEPWGKSISGRAERWR